MALKLFSRKKSNKNALARDAEGNSPASAMIVTPPTYSPAPREKLSDEPIRRLLQQKRYAVISREQEKYKQQQNGHQIVEEATRELERRMALVPAGSVSISQSISGQPGGIEEDSEVEPFLLDIHCVTNSRYQLFIDAGGYDELDYWPEEIWPHLIEFKDLTGEPGPRYWRNGRHDTTLSDHPVVGISWYEAQAFALWVGERLPSEIEWQMAASWHITSTADLLRRFPWGDAMDNQRCNIWSSRIGSTEPVTKYPKGAAPNQVLQLIGNTWEWTDSEFLISDDEGRPIVGEMPMHVVRGGAFDTYFETQATSQFRSGLIALARNHNTGFRCAMDMAQASWINGC